MARRVCPWQRFFRRVPRRRFVMVIVLLIRCSLDSGLGMYHFEDVALVSLQKLLAQGVFQINKTDRLFRSPRNGWHGRCFAPLGLPCPKREATRAGPAGAARQLAPEGRLSRQLRGSAPGTLTSGGRNSEGGISEVWLLKWTGLGGVVTMNFILNSLLGRQVLGASSESLDMSQQRMVLR